MSGEGFYQKSHAVPEGITPLEGIILGLGLMFGANVLRNRKSEKIEKLGNLETSLI